MDQKIRDIEKCAMNNDEDRIVELLTSGLDPNFGNGWPLRTAARYGSYAVLQKFIQFGANPHLLGESGASLLQLAVYSGKHWEENKWAYLLSYCDSSQLADGAAVAIIFKNIPALNKIMATGRCNAHLPTTLTGKTVEELAKGYKLQTLLTCTENLRLPTNMASDSSQRHPRQRNMGQRESSQPSSSHAQRDLSPSVAHFFQTASQTLSPVPQSIAHVNTIYTSPISNR